MTIAAAYLTSEGVVLGGDSSTTVYVSTPKGDGITQLLTHAQKVYEVGENSRFGICTWGAGSIGDLSHRTIIACLADKINDKTSVHDTAKMLAEIVEPLVKENKVQLVGYYLGGWDLKGHVPGCYKIEITPNGKTVEPLSMGNCSFSGNPVYFTRVFRGYDPRLTQCLKDEIKKKLPDTINNFDEIFDSSLERASLPYANVGFKDLPIREAVDFVYSYLHITLKALKFKFGPPSCGGPIEVAFITTDRSFRWVRHKAFSSAITEQEGEYDVK